MMATTLGAEDVNIEDEKERILDHLLAVTRRVTGQLEIINTGMER